MKNIKNNFLSVSINPRGAELWSIKNNNGYEFLWQGNPEIWNGRSPFLFPIVGKIKNDTLTVYGKDYTLQKHGFARKTDFSVVDISESSTAFMLISNENTKMQYPWDFELEITYTLIDNRLKISYKVKNTDSKTMYFSMGGHPGFNCKIGDILEFEKNETLESYVMNKDAYIYKKTPYLNNERKIVITKDIFKDDALMFENTSSDSITLKTQEGYSICVKYNNARFLGLWAKPGAPYVCIEPWFGINDFEEFCGDFSEKYGILSLNTNEKFAYEIEIEFQDNK